MKRTKGIVVTLLSLIMALSFTATPVFAGDDAFVMPPVIMLSAPEQQQRRFDIDGVFDLWTLSNIITPIVICTGDADDLTITMSLRSGQLASKDYLDFMMITAGLSMSAAIFDMQSVTTPYTITSVIDIDNTFAAMAIVALITSVTGVIEEADNAFPLEFEMIFSLTETAAVVE